MLLPLLPTALPSCLSPPDSCILFFSQLSTLPLIPPSTLISIKLPLIPPIQFSIPSFNLLRNPLYPTLHQIVSENIFVKMEGAVAYETDLNLKATELRLGLPGTDETEKEKLSGVRNNKRSSPETNDECETKGSSNGDRETAPVTKAQVVGWPPIRSYRKNSFQPKKNEAEASGMFLKVSMDGAPYLRKIDLKVYKGYPELLQALQNMFKFTIGEYSEREGYKGSEYVPTYEDKDGDWMLVGDVPWDMFMSSCKRLRIMKGSEARGLGCGV